MSSVEILDKKNTIRKAMEDIIFNCKAEVREMTQEEREYFDNAKLEIRQLNQDMEDLKKTLETYKIETEETRNNEINNNLNKTNMEFKLIKAINDIANNRSLDSASQSVVDAGAKEMRNSGLSYGGQIQLPVSELRSDITVTSEGGDTVGVDVYDFLAPLRAKNVLVQAGAKFLTGLVGDCLIPVMNGANVTWEAEVTGATDGGVTYTSAKLQPKRLSAYLDVSKQFLVQTSADAEAMLKQDIINAINTKLEATILGKASGTTTQPAGIFYSATALPSISGYSGITTLESDVEDVNVNGQCAYIASNKAKAALRSMIKGTNGTGMVYENGGIDGTPLYNTSNVGETKGIAFGDFSNLAIGQWGSIDLTVDPYTVAKEGKVRIVVNAFFDAKVLRSGAIKVAKIA